VKLSRTNGRGLDLFQQPTHGQLEGMTASSPCRGRRRRRHRGRDRSSDSSRASGLPSDHVFMSRPHARDPGDSSGEATPVPIPNTVVKLSSAEDTQGAAPRENRPSPGSFALEVASRSPAAPILRVVAENVAELPSTGDPSRLLLACRSRRKGPGARRHRIIGVCSRIIAKSRCRRPTVRTTP
jgi:hypothetical protein